MVFFFRPSVLPNHNHNNHTKMDELTFPLFLGILTLENTGSEVRWGKGGGRVEVLSRSGKGRESSRR